MITLHQAGWRDIYRLWRWRNDPETRRQFRYQGRVGFWTHLQWFRRLNPRHERLFVAWLQDLIPIGTVRLDGDVQHPSTISVTLAPHYRGQGWSRAIIEAAVAENQGGAVFAQIRVGNQRSIRAFTSAGFVPDVYSQSDGEYVWYVHR